MANGPQSRGTCSLCGSTRFFGNVFDDVMVHPPGYGRNYYHVRQSEMSAEIKELLEWRIS